MQVVMIVQVWWIFVLSADGGVVQRSPVQLDVAEYRPMAKREPTAEEIRAALLDVLNEQKIPVSSSAKTRLRVEIAETEKQDDEGKTCARVRSWIVDIDKQYLPKREIVTERCVLTSEARIPAA